MAELKLVRALVDADLHAQFKQLAEETKTDVSRYYDKAMRNFLFVEAPEIRREYEEETGLLNKE